MPAIGKPFELHKMRRQRRCDIGLALDRVYRIIFKERKGADFRAAKAFEQGHAPVSMGVSGGFGADEHELGGVGRMARRESQRNHAAK